MPMYCQELDRPDVIDVSKINADEEGGNVKDQLYHYLCHVYVTIYNSLCIVAPCLCVQCVPNDTTHFQKDILSLIPLISMYSWLLWCVEV